MVRYNWTVESKVVAFHSLGVTYMCDKPHLFIFKDNDDTVIKGVSFAAKSETTAVSASLQASGTSGILSVNESTARLCAKYVNYVCLGSADRLRVLAPELLQNYIFLFPF